MKEMFHVKQRRMDYHLHTLHSMDGRQTVDELCRSMAERGVEEICLTEAFPVRYPTGDGGKGKIFVHESFGGEE